MAKYIFALMRSPADAAWLQQRMEDICVELTPDLIRDGCGSIVAEWPGLPGGWYAIQNSDGINLPDDGGLVIGRAAKPPDGAPSFVGVDSDGSYAVIKAASDAVSFFVDQFGSRTLWYYHDERMLVVSTSQRAVIGLKGSYRRSDEVVAWFLSSGCQGPFISWDEEVHQVRPDHEYVLDVASWALAKRKKPGMELPESGTVRMKDFLKEFEQQVAGTLVRMVQESGPGHILLPLSGGLDSRLLLGLCRHVGIEDNVTLVNWGVPAGDDVFDDKAAALRVARAYGKPLMDMTLPVVPDNHDQVLERFVRESEGRIDHFNAYTDGFAMWADIHQRGFRRVVRGDIPYTEGMDLDEAQSRAHIGLEPFSDYANLGEFPLGGYASFQQSYDISRLHQESLVRWRDRLYVGWRMPMVISAFSDLMSGYAESRAPMVSWSLFMKYMALPDSAKGSKAHIKTLWKKHDRSGVPSHAVGSLRSLAEFFKSEVGVSYLEGQLDGCRERGRFDPELVVAVQRGLVREGAVSDGPAGWFAMRAKGWISDHIPDRLKAHLKARRVKRLSATTLAYRMVLADKVIAMYETAATVRVEGGR